MEAAQQGTIPLCSDINILRYSSAPFAEFVFSEELGFNPLIHFCQDYFELFSMDYKIISEAWIEKINHLEEHPSIQMMLFQNLNYVNGFLEKRYEDSVGSFFTHLHNRQELEKNLIVYHYDNKKRFGNNTDGGYVTGVLEGKYDCYISAGIGDDEELWTIDDHVIPHGFTYSKVKEYPDDSFEKEVGVTFSTDEHGYGFSIGHVEVGMLNGVKVVFDQNASPFGFYMKKSDLEKINIG